MSVATIDVNVANQAYPPPPFGSQGLPVPSSVLVPSVPFLQPSFSQGTAQAFAPDVNVSLENNTFFPAQDIIVTENGNFATNNVSADVQTFLIASIVLMGPSPPDSTSVYQINMTDQNGNPVKLSSYGVDFTQLFASFPKSAQPLNPGNVPSRQITAFNDPNTIVVAALDALGNPFPTTPVDLTPKVSDPVTIPILRQGASLTVDSNVNEIDVTVAPRPPVALTVQASGSISLGDFFPNNPGLPFIGSGLRAPPFIGTFEVEDQVPLGKGLPANVFV